MLESGSTTRSADECEMSRSCHSATFSNAACAFERTTRASPLMDMERFTRHLEEALRGADVITLLRVQKERLAGTKISLQDYVARYQMTMARLKLARKDAMLMHPGPIIRGLELTWEVADCPQSVIVEEVRNGVPTRMAILALSKVQMVRSAASFIVRNGPVTQQDRWEEDAGYSPFTLAVEISGLLGRQPHHERRAFSDAGAVALDGPAVQFGEFVHFLLRANRLAELERDQPANHPIAAYEREQERRRRRRGHDLGDPRRGRRSRRGASCRSGSTPRPPPRDR